MILIYVTQNSMGLHFSLQWSVKRKEEPKIKPTILLQNTKHEKINVV